MNNNFMWNAQTHCYSSASNLAALLKAFIRKDKDIDNMRSSSTGQKLSFFEMLNLFIEHKTQETKSEKKTKVTKKKKDSKENVVTTIIEETSDASDPKTSYFLHCRYFCEYVNHTKEGHSWVMMKIANKYLIYQSYHSRFKPYIQIVSQRKFIEIVDHMYKIGKACQNVDTQAFEISKLLQKLDKLLGVDEYSSHVDPKHREYSHSLNLTANFLNDGWYKQFYDLSEIVESSTTTEKKKHKKHKIESKLDKSDDDADDDDDDDDNENGNDIDTHIDEDNDNNDDNGDGDQKDLSIIENILRIHSEENQITKKICATLADKDNFQQMKVVGTCLNNIKKRLQKLKKLELKLSENNLINKNEKRKAQAMISRSKSKAYKKKLRNAKRKINYKV